MPQKKELLKDIKQDKGKTILNIQKKRSYLKQEIFIDKKIQGKLDDLVHTPAKMKLTNEINK